MLYYVAWLLMGGEGGEREAGAGGTFGWGRRNQAGEEGSEGGEITSAECLRANERTEEAAKPREMMDLRTAFILLCGCCREETGEKGRGGGE